jgi:thiosulfate/3-mercaptopyruvate sulfurtransferase
MIQGYSVRNFCAVLLCLLGLARGALAQSQSAKPGEKGDQRPAPLLVSFKELEQKLKDPHLRLLDCQTRDNYDKGHLPGAVWVDTKQLETQAAKPEGLNDQAFWEKWGSSLGIDAESTVLIYDSRRQLDAARVWFFLRWIGVQKVGLVNGGYPLWSHEKRPTTTVVPKVPPIPFQVHFNPQISATRKDVSQALADHSAAILDARSAGEFSGADRKSKRGGHIPSACHLEWTNLVDEEGRFLERDLLKQRIEKSGIPARAEVITHCQGGGRASVNTFALELVGFRARNYYLGWSDWGNQEATAVESGDKATKP